MLEGQADYDIVSNWEITGIVDLHSDHLQKRRLITPTTVTQAGMHACKIMGNSTIICYLWQSTNFIILLLLAPPTSRATTYPE
jgi:hypothetical protein